MRIASNQTAENFIEQLIKARRELVGLGCEYITLEDHCKNLLQEAMLQDDRFRDQANAFSAASDVTWKKMTSEVTAREMNETEKQQTTSTSSNSTAPLPHNIVRKLTAIVERHQNRGQRKGKGKSFNGKCFKCGKQDTELILASLETTTHLRVATRRPGEL